MTPDQIVSRFNVSRESSAALRIYVELLIKWQKRINLIGPSTVGDIWQRHIADALEISQIIPSDAKTIVDLGSGAGIPGLVFSIAFGEDRDFFMHLVESNGKKAAFLREAIRLTGAKAKVHHKRVEEVAADCGTIGIDAVLARAVAPLGELLNMAEPFIESGATGYFHKGQDVDTELTAATKCWIINATKHIVGADSVSCILEIKEISRVARL